MEDGLSGVMEILGCLFFLVPGSLDLQQEAPGDRKEEKSEKSNAGDSISWEILAARTSSYDCPREGKGKGKRE